MNPTGGKFPFLSQNKKCSKELFHNFHGIKYLANILNKHLTNLGQMWPKYLSLATFAYNTFNTPNLGNHSPYELIFGRKPRSWFHLDLTQLLISRSQAVSKNIMTY